MTCRALAMAARDHNAAQYRAEVARLLEQADRAIDPKVRTALLEIAQYYERMAARALVRRSGGDPLG